MLIIHVILLSSSNNLTNRQTRYASINKLLYFYLYFFQVMKPIAKALDILQGEKYIYIGYLLPTLTAVKKSKSTFIAQKP